MTVDLWRAVLEEGAFMGEGGEEAFRQYYMNTTYQSQDVVKQAVVHHSGINLTTETPVFPDLGKTALLIGHLIIYFAATPKAPIRRNLLGHSCRWY